MKFLCTLCVLCGLVLPARALDREAFTFTKYDLDVRIEPDQQRLAVRGAITLRNDSNAPQKNFSLQISSSLDWRSIQADGKPVQFLTQEYTSDIDHTGSLSEAIISLPREIPPKGAVELEIGYEGIIPQDATRLTRMGVPEDTAKHTDWDQIGKSFTAVRGLGYVTWYPVAIEAVSLSEGNTVFEALARWKARERLSEFKMKWNYAGTDRDDPPLMLCNGRNEQQGHEQINKSRSITVECNFSTLSDTVPLFVNGDYQNLDRPAASVSYIPGHDASAQSYATAAETTLPFITQWFGSPHSKAEVVELADSQAAPFENGSLLLTPLSNVDASLAEIAVVHQLTHAAFPSPRLWIAEGLAHFAQVVYREHQAGRAAALTFMDMHRLAMVDAETASLKSHPPDAATDSLLTTSREEFYRSKAMYVWWMLCDMVGEDVLKRALATYHLEQDKDPAYVQHLVESQSKRDLQSFFDDWVYHDRGLPDFRVESVYPRQTQRGGYLVTVTVENLGNAGAEVPVTLGFEGGELTQRLEVKAKSKNSIRFDVASLPTGALVNDGSVPESDLGNNVFKGESGK